MTERALGQSGLSIRPFVLGGNVFGMTADRAASFAVLDRFVEHDGGMIDTDDVYSAWVPGHKGGESESMMGAWRSEEHTSELQPLMRITDAVICLTKKEINIHTTYIFSTQYKI